MTRYIYKARDRFGVEKSGYLDAPSQKDASALLEIKKLTPISIIPKVIESVEIEKFLKKIERKVRIEDLIIFTQQLSSLVNSGVNLIESLDAVHDQIKSGQLKSAIKSVKGSIEEGSSFSDALQKHPKIFSNFMVNMIKAGEKAGILGKILDRTSKILEKELDTQKKIQSSIRYPVLVLFALSIAFIVIVTFIIPRFSIIYSSFKSDLPLPTRILININFAVRNYWFLFFAGIGAFSFAFKKAIENPKGRLEFDRFLLKLPVFGALITKIILSRFSRMLSAMLNAGITVVESLTISSRTTGNELMAKIILSVKEDIIKGETLSSSMKSASIFPPVVVQMVAVGEKGGNLEDMLTRVSEYFEKETDYMAENLTSLIEPMLIFGLGLVVLTLAMGVFLPIWNLMQLYR